MPTFLSQIRDGAVAIVLRLRSGRPRILGSILGRGERFLSAAWLADPLWSRPSLLYYTNTTRYVYGTHAFCANSSVVTSLQYILFVRMNCTPLLPSAFSIYCYITKNRDGKVDGCVLPVFTSPLCSIRSRSNRSKMSAYCK
jgi:hypothetical protein